MKCLACLTTFCARHQVLVIDTKTDTVDTFGYVPAGNEKWSGAVEGPDGLLYCIPSWATNILVIDPMNRTLEFFGHGLPDEAFKWNGGVLAPDGFIYCIPALSKQVLRIDPIKRETVLFGIIRGKEIKYENGFVGKDGNIFAMPISTKSGMLCIDLKAAERMEAERKAEAEQKIKDKQKAIRDKERAKELELLKSKSCKARSKYCCKVLYRLCCHPIVRCFKGMFFAACPCFKPKPKLTVKKALRLKPQDMRKELKKRKLDQPDDLYADKQDLLDRLIDSIEAENYVPPAEESEEESEEELEPMPIWPPLVTFGTVPPGFDKWTAGVALNGDTVYPMPAGNTSVIKINVNYTKKQEAIATIVDHLPGSYPEVDREAAAKAKAEKGAAAAAAAAKNQEKEIPSQELVLKEEEEVMDAISDLIEADVNADAEAAPDG